MIRTGFIFSILTAMMLVSSAYGYIPPSGFMLQSMAKKKKDLESVTVRTIVQRIDENAPTGDFFTEITQYSKGKRRLLSVIADEDRSFELLRDMSSIGGNNTPLLNFLLFDDAEESLILSVRERGIPVLTETEILALTDETERRQNESTFLRKWREIVSWGIGANPVDLSVPALWVEKDTFQPLRVIYNSKGSQVVELQLSQMRYYKGYPYPVTIDVLENGVWVLRAKLERIDVNEKNFKMTSRNPTSNLKRIEETNLSNSLISLAKRYYQYVR